MSELIDAFPLAAEYSESIRARLIEDVNAGKAPTDQRYAHMEPGSIHDDIFGACSIQFDQAYDRMHNEVPAAALPTTATGQWLDAWADLFDVQRLDAAAASGIVRFTGPNTTPIPIDTLVSTESPTPDADPITYKTTSAGVITGGYVDLPVVAIVPGAPGSVGVNSITILDSVIGGATVTVSNPLPITGGADIESDERLVTRVARKFTATKGAGNNDFYIDLGLAQPGVGFVTVQNGAPSTGDVTVMITDINNDPMSAASVAAFQQVLDPATPPSQGAGAAPPGAIATAATPAILAVTISVAAIPATGFSVDGDPGTRPLRDPMSVAIHAYVNGLNSGGDIVRNKATAALVDVDGVEDITGLTINGSTTGDLAVAANQSAVLTSFVVS